MKEQIRNAVYGTYYRVAELMWRPKTVQQDAVYDRLRTQGLTLSMLNSELNDFPKTMGRFPKLFEEIPSLPVVVDHHLETIVRSISDQNLTGSERVETIRNYVSRSVAHDLSLSPEVFKKIVEDYALLR